MTGTKPIQSPTIPEGPEIRRAADKLSRVLDGQIAQEVELLLPGLSRHESRLRGRRILKVQPRSKAMLIHFVGGYSVYSHNQLYGRWYVVRAGATARTQRSLRFAIHTREHSALLFSASDIAVLSAAQLRRHPYLCKLGPDLLDPETTLAQGAARGRLGTRDIFLPDLPATAGCTRAPRATLTCPGSTLDFGGEDRQSCIQGI